MPSGSCSLKVCPFPTTALPTTRRTCRSAAARFLDAGNDKVVVKAQVLVGGRGKAGGVKLASSAEEAAAVAAQIIGMDIKGTTVRRVLVAPAADIVSEYYLACVLDRERAPRPVHGLVRGRCRDRGRSPPVGPTRSSTMYAHPLLGLLDYQARELGFKLGLGAHLRDFVAIAKGLFATMMANDADLVEINPLAIVRSTGADGHRLRSSSASTPR